MGLAALLETHFPTHGNWQGLGCGRVATIWLSSILSRGDHRLVHVEPWVARRQCPLSHLIGEAVRAHALSDDRLAIVLRLLSDEQRWAALEAALNPHLVRVYDLRTERVHVDSTSASASTRVSAEGLLQFGQSKDHRPDLPQVKIMQAVLDPLGMPLATDVVAGERADDPLYLPCIERVQQSVGRNGLLFVGACKMAARDTRALLALAGDSSRCPLPQAQLDAGEFDEALERVYSGGQALRDVLREQEQGDPVLIAQGYEYNRPMSVSVDGAERGWTERRSLGSVRGGPGNRHSYCEHLCTTTVLGS